MYKLSIMTAGVLFAAAAFASTPPAYICPSNQLKNGATYTVPLGSFVRFKPGSREVTHGCSCSLESGRPSTLVCAYTYAPYPTPAHEYFFTCQNKSGTQHGAWSINFSTKSAICNKALTR